ncbi:MAG TPA: nuclear transport factor 2 family protein [Hyphomicrobium sp.]|nr:nuclear transport factor 2 family protein [Hyphomicrobium sp.]
MTRSPSIACRALMVAVTGVALSAAARADDAADIRTRLVQWTRDFNAGHKAAACDLFSKDLISDFRGQGEADYATRCALITRAIDDPNREFRYQLQIKEIIPSGDMAVVRLNWILGVSPPGHKSVETGLDVFRKEKDGVWRIIRYVAYEAP